MTLPLATERDIQRGTIAWLRRVLPEGSIVFAIVNEQRADEADPFARARFAAARRKSGVVTGFPDIGILLPDASVFLLELKRPKTGVLSTEQLVLHDRIRAIGHRVAVADGIDVARYVLRQAGVPLREHDPNAHADQSALAARAERLATKARPKSTAAGRRMRKIAAVNKIMLETLPR